MVAAAAGFFLLSCVDDVRLDDALDELPCSQRIAFKARFLGRWREKRNGRWVDVEGPPMRIQEIADMLDASDKAVYTILDRAVANLRRRLCDR